MIIVALALLGQVPLLGFAEDQRAFEPVRRCVLTDARSQYRTGRNPKVIFEQARMRCARADLRASSTITLRAIERAEKANDRPDFNERLSRLYEELFFEVANDFVPKSN